MATFQCVNCGEIRDGSENKEYNEDGLLKCPGCGEVTDVYLLDAKGNRIEEPF